MHSFVEQPANYKIELVCPPHFEMIMADKKRQKEAFDIIKQCFDGITEFEISFEEGAAEYSPYGQQQQRMTEQRRLKKEALRHSLVAQVFQKLTNCEEKDLTQTSSRS